MPRSLTAALVVLALGACSSTPPPAEPEPADDAITRLEALRAANPADPVVAVELGSAYRRAGELERARALFEEATDLPGAPPRAWANLGALAEMQEDWAAAERAYAAYLERGGEQARSRVAPRLRLVRRNRMEADARRLLEREAQLSAEEVDPAVVAVMPLQVEGAEEYEPLGRGFAELLTTDLSMTDRLRVVERAQLQALLTEMRLGLGGYVDPATAARTGVLTRAGRVVQGLIGDPSQGDLTVEATVVAAGSPSDRVSVRRTGVLERMFDIEAELALGLYEELGIQLTSAEIARIREHPTSNIQAFLAYSRGLGAMDRGDFDQAREHFQQATEMDPSFNEAAQEQEEAASLSVAAAAAPADLAADADEEEAEAGPAEEEADGEEPEEEEEASDEEASDEEAAAETQDEADAGADESGGDSGGDQGGGGTSSTMEGLSGSAAPAGAGAATETTTAAGSSGGDGDGGTSSSGTNTGSSTPATRGEGVMVDRVLEWTLTRPQPLIWRWRW